MARMVLDSLEERKLREGLPLWAIVTSCSASGFLIVGTDWWLRGPGPAVAASSLASLPFGGIWLYCHLRHQSLYWKFVGLTMYFTMMVSSMTASAFAPNPLFPPFWELTLAVVVVVGALGLATMKAQTLPDGWQTRIGLRRPKVLPPQTASSPDRSMGGWLVTRTSDVWHLVFCIATSLFPLALIATIITAIVLGQWLIASMLAISFISLIVAYFAATQLDDLEDEDEFSEGGLRSE